jgi:peptidyl-prolyl cis-trans isomerase B (cyclophilin B)
MTDMVRPLVPALSALLVTGLVLALGCNDQRQPVFAAVPAQTPAAVTPPPAAPVAETAPGVDPAPPAAAAQAPTAPTAPTDPVLQAIDQSIALTKVDTAIPRWRLAVPRPPAVPAYDAAREYLWVLTTTAGTIVIKLDPAAAPQHVTSTIWLTRLGFYDGLGFHRIIPNFMAQGGCPLGTGTGSPGYTYAGEFLTKRRHDRPGLLSMANAGPGTDGSQFFLTFVATPHLDGRHTIFGETITGLDVLKTLERSGSDSGRTTTKQGIIRATIEVR